MAQLPPPSIDLPPPDSQPQSPPGPLDRWHGVARWKRWAAYGLTAFVGLSAIGAATGSGNDEPGSLRTAGAIAATTVLEPATTPAATVPAPTEPTTTEPPTTVAAVATVAPTTPPSVQPAPSVPGSMAALDVLAFIPTERETPDGYNRDLFGYGKPVDEFGCRTRALVLIRDSLTPAQIDRAGCAVVAGDWFSPYDGVTRSDVGELEIDHVVALKEAWDSGASQWDADRLEAYANDVAEPRTLRAVTGAANQSKGDKDPVNWLPPDESAVCQYLADWVSIKARWGLSMDESEHGRVGNLLADRCPGQLVAPWEQVPPAVLNAPIAPVPTPTPTPTPIPAPPPPAVGGNCDPSYPGVCIPPAPPDLDCGDVTFKRFQVLPPDPHHFDRDGDGIGCES